MYLERFASARVCVLGDVMLDRYFWGRVDRISPEAPVPVVRVNNRSSRLGGAANVAANLCSLGVDVALAGVTGNDVAGDEIGEKVRQAGIGSACLCIEEGRETTEKVRIIAQSQQVVRADFESESPLSSGNREKILAEIVGGIDGFDALIVSDYGKGVIQEALLGEVISAWKAAGKPVLIDPHVGHFKWYRGATIITPNTREAASFYGATVDREELFTTAGFHIREELELGALLITRGEDGMSLFLEDQKQIHVPTMATDVYDVTGAGDTVISLLGAALACRLPLIDAVLLANQAAGEVVKDIGTSTISKEELVNSFND
jgi:D-beta-D-heptose 7-phosphate kinase/D-beta-D-heptose 1-phosphate adenosyltransferase